MNTLESLAAKLALPGFLEDLKRRKRLQDDYDVKYDQAKRNIELEFKTTWEELDQKQLEFDIFMTEHQIMGNITKDEEQTYKTALKICEEMRLAAKNKREEKLNQLAPVRIMLLNEQLYLELRESSIPIVCKFSSELETIISSWANCRYCKQSYWKNGESGMIGDPICYESVAYPPPIFGKVLIVCKKQ